MLDIQRPRYLTREQAAAYLCVSVPTLARWASQKTGPRYYRLGRNARYLEADLNAFAESRRSDRRQDRHVADPADAAHDTSRI
jgi:excisionase family DNA binding protein